MELDNNIENTIIQHLLTNGTYFTKTFSKLKSTHFSSIENQEIFKSMQQYYKDFQVTPHPKEIGLLLKDIKSDKLKTNTIEHFKQIMKSEKISNLDFLLNKTQEYVQRTEFKKVVLESAEAFQNGKDLDPYAEKMREALKTSFDTDLGLDYKTDVQRRLDYYKRAVEGFGTGIAALDEKIIFAPSTLNIIASVSHGGKSLLMSHCASNLLLHGKNVLIVSLEMTEEELTKRIDANVLNIDINTLRTTSNEEFMRVWDTIGDKLGNLIVKEYGANIFSVLNLEALYHDIYNKYGYYPDIIFIDYLTLMKAISVSPSVGSFEYYKYVSEELHSFSKKYKIPIVTATQLNRSGYGNMEAGLESVSSSLAIAQTADTFMSIIRNKEMDEVGQVLITIQKNRQKGNLNSTVIGIDYPHMRYYDLGGDNTIINTNPIDLDVALDGFDGDVSKLDIFGGIDGLGF